MHDSGTGEGHRSVVADHRDKAGSSISAHGYRQFQPETHPFLIQFDPPRLGASRIIPIGATGTALLEARHANVRTRSRGRRNTHTRVYTRPNDKLKTTVVATRNIENRRRESTVERTEQQNESDRGEEEGELFLHRPGNRRVLRSRCLSPIERFAKTSFRVTFSRRQSAQLNPSSFCFSSALSSSVPTRIEQAIVPFAGTVRLSSLHTGHTHARTHARKTQTVHRR